MAKVNLILPAKNLPPSELRGAIKAAMSLVEKKDGLTVADFEIYGSDPAALQEFQAFYAPVGGFRLESGDICVAIYGKDTPAAINLSALKRGELFWINDSGQITTVDGKYDERLTPGIKKHIFSQMLPDAASAFGDFPYIQLMLDQRLRPITPLGHRIEKSLEGGLADRPGHHKVIALFGGSAAQGINVYYEDMFSHRLEMLLNRHASSGDEYSVLNFALSGHMVTDELLTYIFFCDQLRPDIVMTFDGWNDLANGMVNDPYLVNEWQFAYRHRDEKRALFLNSVGKETAPVAQKPLQAKNSPAAVIRCYLHRLDQFGALVQARGGRFIACLQPCLYSKSAMSSAEAQALKTTARNNPELFEIFDTKMPQLLEMIPSPYAELDFETVNFHNLFKRYGGEYTLFSDRVHLHPDGEAVIAEELLKVIQASAQKKAVNE